MKEYKIKWDEIMAKVNTVQESVLNCDFKFYGIDPNGKVLTGLIGNPCEYPDEADVFVGSIYENDALYTYYYENYGDKEFCFFYNREAEHENEKLIFPWE